MNRFGVAIYIYLILCHLISYYVMIILYIVLYFTAAWQDRDHVSGKPRIFQDSIQAIELHAGDLCSMEGSFQRHYSHQIAKGMCDELESPAAVYKCN